MSTTHRRTLIWALSLFSIFVLLPYAHAQAALLMEEPYGIFGALNPTGHNALYFANICAETPVTLRRCQPGELGTVIARYQGIDHYDWVAMPLIPYLYSVEDVGDVPAHVDKHTVATLRSRYHEEHLGVLGTKVFEGGFTHGGWNQLIGVSYERRIYAFRFATTPEQDDALIAQMNDSVNRSKFNLLYSNCADFARGLMNQYFPKTFNRTVFPDAGMTTPREIAYKLVKYSKKHPETDLAVYEIPQVPGYRHPSHANKSVAASLITTGYAIPIAILNPYLAGGLFIDYLIRGRFPLIQGHPQALTPDTLSMLASKSMTPLPLATQPPLSAQVAQAVSTTSTRDGAQSVPAGTTAPATIVNVSVGVHE
jgi:hypothetical protein